MNSYQNALQMIEDVALTRRLNVEKCSILDAVGRVLAEDVVGTEAVPSFDNSAMDGFALSAAWTERASIENPLRFKVSLCLTAGDAIAFQDTPVPTAVQIMTGAPLPESLSRSRFDAVIKIEEVKVIREEQGMALEIEITRPLKLGENIRMRGEDFTPGRKVATLGSILLPEHIMAMASLGISHVQVLQRPRIGIMATGKELVGFETASLAPGMIRNSSSPYLRTVASLFGCDATFLGVVLDDQEVFENLVRENLGRFDILITTGAVSMGIHDFVGDSLSRLGAKTHFHKAAIRPGKPVLFAEFEGGPVVFGAPGNPISTSVCWRFFVAPYLRAFSRRKREKPFFARLSESVRKPEGLRCFFKAQVEFRASELFAKCLKGQASFMVSPLLSSHTWAVLPEEGTEIRAGTLIELLPLYPAEDLFRDTEVISELTQTHQECCK